MLKNSFSTVTKTYVKNLVTVYMLAVSYILLSRIRKKAIRDLKQIKDSTALFDKQQITEILMVSHNHIASSSL